MAKTKGDFSQGRIARPDSAARTCLRALILLCAGASIIVSLFSDPRGVVALALRGSPIASTVFVAGASRGGDLGGREGAARICVARWRHLVEEFGGTIRTACADEDIVAVFRASDVPHPYANKPAFHVNGLLLAHRTAELVEDPLFPRHTAMGRVVWGNVWLDSSDADCSGWTSRAASDHAASWTVHYYASEESTALNKPCDAKDQFVLCVCPGASALHMPLHASPS